MIGRFLWADGQLYLLPGLSKTTHKQMVARLPFQPAGFASGDFNLERNETSVLWARGNTPTEAELNFMIHNELGRYGREQRIRDRIAAAPMWDENVADKFDPRYNPPGMPRPIYDNKPVPWSSDSFDLGTVPGQTRIPQFEVIDSTRQYRAWYQNRCVLCGEQLVDPVYAYIYVDGEKIVDGGLHQRCASITRAHCPHIRDAYADGRDQLITVPLSIWEQATANGMGVANVAGLDHLREVEGGKEQIQVIGATSEDTEPEGKEVGFLRDPHKVLYPYLFPDGGTNMPEKVRHLIKSHVLNQLEEAFEDPDNFIYFTVYGSGVAYNWDEGGDLDVQMWIDIEKFQALNDEKATWTMDDLLAEIRRHVQLVNFPTVKEIGLVPSSNSEEEVTGEMLVQYYPKPGKGTEEENLAQKPYACLDLETGEWIVKPKPIDPTFYGLHFLELMPKATDMAIQAEALLDEFERNVLNWQFWFSLYSRYRNPAYQQQYQEAQRNAIMEHEGIKNMFQGIFGGRQEAYSPEGQGIEDERDMLQKLLEVWGVFQRLKHFSRAPLPWTEQELPEPTSALSLVPPIEGEPGPRFKTNDPVSGARGSDREGMRGYVESGPDEDGYYMIQWYPLDSDIEFRREEELVPFGYTGPRKHADHNGWTNYETWWVEVMIDNEQHNNAIANDLVTRGDIKAFEQWAIGTFIAPNNAEAIKGAQEWNDIPEAERLDYDLESLKDKYRDNPDAQNMFNNMFGQGDVGDKTPNIIDPNVVNWHELFTHRQQDIENEYRFEHDMPLTWEEEIDQDSPGDSTFPAEWTSKWKLSIRPRPGNYGDYLEMFRKMPLEELQQIMEANTSTRMWESWSRSNYYHALDRVIREKSRISKSNWRLAGSQDSPEHRDPGGWAGIMEKAQRLRTNQQVQLQRNGVQNIVGIVQGDHGTYNTEIWRQDPQRNTISLWNCDCPWGGYSWGRTRQFKKYEGRPCAHTLALYWESLTHPLDEEYGENQQLSIPGIDPYQTPPPGQEQTPVDLNRALQQTIRPQMPEPQPIMPQQEQLNLTFPGAFSRVAAINAVKVKWSEGDESVLEITGKMNRMWQAFSIENPDAFYLLNNAGEVYEVLDDLSQSTPIGYVVTGLDMDKSPTDLTLPPSWSKWHKRSALQNGDYARIKKPLIGIDDFGTQHTVPRNSIVEIIWSDPTETIAIYSLNTPALGPHNARIVSDTENFVWVPRTRGTAPRRHR